MSAPEILEGQLRVVTEVEMRRLLEVCSGKRFADRRDTAILP
jgi:hypothetical protein